MKASFLLAGVAALFLAVMAYAAQSKTPGFAVLRESDLSSLRAGADCGTDCYDMTSGCITRTVCTFDHECAALTKVCIDQTKNQYCGWDSTWDLWDCVWDPNHNCTPQKAEIPDCGWGYCKFGGADLGNCGTTAFQCHN
jgi:hypothetical protein